MKTTGARSGRVSLTSNSLTAGLTCLSQIEMCWDFPHLLHNSIDLQSQARCPRRRCHSIFKKLTRIQKIHSEFKKLTPNSQKSL